MYCKTFSFWFDIVSAIFLPVSWPIPGMIFQKLSHGCTVFIWLQNVLNSDPEVIKLVSCSTQLSTKFQLLIKVTKNRQIKKFLALGLSDVVLYHANKR